uniref:THUMP domain-containing protein n=1 Tax=Parastrongyloides trichosuri TaxID=131310 RepID=A0A0N4ZJL9_PARTI
MVFSLISLIASVVGRSKRVENMTKKLTSSDYDADSDNDSSYINSEVNSLNNSITEMSEPIVRKRFRKRNWNDSKKIVENKEDEPMHKNMRSNIKSLLNCSSLNKSNNKDVIENYHLKNVSFLKRCDNDTLDIEEMRFKRSKEHDKSSNPYTDDYTVACDSVITDAFTKLSIDYIISSSLYRFGSELNVGASYTIISKKCVFVQATRMRPEASEEYILAKVLYDGVEEACSRFPGAKILVHVNTDALKEFLDERNKNKNFLDSIPSFKVKTLLTGMCRQELLNKILFEYRESRFITGILEISCKTVATIQGFGKPVKKLSSFTYYERIMGEDSSEDD